MRKELNPSAIVAGIAISTLVIILAGWFLFFGSGRPPGETDPKMIREAEAASAAGYGSGEGRPGAAGSGYDSYSAGRVPEGAASPRRVGESAEDYQSRNAYGLNSDR